MTKANLLWVAVMALLSGSSAWAAKGALVDADGADMRRGPGPKYGIVQKLKKGTPLVVSNYPTEGYYKARTLRGEVGWVSSTSVSFPKPGEGAAPMEGAATKEESGE